MANPLNFCRVRTSHVIETLLSVFHTLSSALQTDLLALLTALVLDGHRLGSELRAYCALLDGAVARRVARMGNGVASAATCVV